MALRFGMTGKSSTIKHVPPRHMTGAIRPNEVTSNGERHLMPYQSDIDLTASDIQQMSSREGVRAFFTGLGYNVSPIEQRPENYGIENRPFGQHCLYFEQIGVEEDTLYILLFEMRSVRVTDRQVLARALEKTNGRYLLVITDQDYDRIDFVLMDEAQPEKPRALDAFQQPPKVAFTPRVLTVKRNDPGRVALRVLKRLTYTQTDADFQYDKLRAAFITAEWAEALFNNRALFSDYYLDERLKDEPEWQEPIGGAYHAFAALMTDAHARLGDLTTGNFWDQYVFEVLDLLGFEVDAPAEDADGPQPDVDLYAPDGDQPLAACLAYRWDRLLDGRDDRDDDKRKEDNPGQRVVTLLEAGRMPFVILTNGKLWRLYARDAHARATNYYEIDLEETLAAPDREIAFRYFWLFFRQAAFEPVETLVDGELSRLCFIERVMQGSETYAKRLGERLKERVFETIFSHFAEGFIASVRDRDGRSADLSQERLDLIYQATLTFLYRLMFLLYAEARDLLPVRDVRGYYERSLRRLVGEIAEQAGEIEDEAPDRIKKAYSPRRTDLYDRLRDLFAVIDRGSTELGVPRYNGGLFITDPGPDGDPLSAFLNAYAVPDRHLALGLDRLARDVDDKTGALAFIDYKSLGVRQLGSIYEGLLEFKLHVAPEKMAIIKGKRTEEVVPYRAVKKKDILRAGRGKDAPERVLEAGAVYLENNRRERKATGSYYTPDYIVKYIVEHTVGPVLDEKLAALRPRLDEAQRQYYQHVERTQDKNRAAGREAEDAEKFWNREDMQRLAYDVLDIKVLDPAMGSGHFLVEAVDFITDRLLDFLNGFPHNPVRASLRRTREAILSAMDEQGVSIDRGRLTDVALLKRAVLKRCVYGVDLNPMAVELAKVSLWLDAFTLGAPLSFLDHHLRCGNSLIGATAREADAELAQMGRAPGQMTFMAGPFKGLLRAAEVMRGVSMLADATIEQAAQSADLFADFERAALPYKRLLDIYVMRAFGVQRADEFLRLHGVDALNLPPERVGRPYDEVLRQREEMYAQYRFFHWDLEFPEVFIDLERADWKADPGFDAVVGNPPYVAFREFDDAHRDYFRSKYDYFVQKGDVYILFLELSVKIASQHGLAGFIVSNKFMRANYGNVARGTMYQRGLLSCLIDFKDSPVFEDATTYPLIVIQQMIGAEAALPEHVRWLEIQASSPSLIESSLNQRNLVTVPYDKLDRDIWSQSPADLLAEKLEGENFAQLAELADQIGRGVVPGLLEAYVIKNEVAVDNQLEDEHIFRVLSGGDIDRYEVASETELGCLIFPYRVKGTELELVKADHIPNIIQFLSRYRPQLEERRNWGSRLIDQGYEWYELAYNSPGMFNRKIIVPDIAAHNEFYPDKDGDIACLDTCYYATFPGTGETWLFYLTTLLNSRLLDFYFDTLTTNVRGGYRRYKAQYLSKLPIRRIDFTTPTAEREAIVADMTTLCPGDLPAVLAGAAAELAAGRTDTVHDLLAFLAGQMIDLNKAKQAEVRRFLGWLEGTLGARIDDFTGKTIIQGYLGDYQKGEDYLPFADFLDRLHRNRARLSRSLDAAFEHQLAQEYEASLGVLLPIKQQLADTDWLIDQIVYKLYGLTDEEIAIVEERG